MSFRIAIIVHGRFYAFDLARELIKQGHQVTLLTNYPKHIVEKFDVPKSNVRSFVVHGLISRLFNRFKWLPLFRDSESWLSPWFSCWAANVIHREILSYGDFDVIHCFSGIAEEVFQSLPKNSTFKALVRGSSHIDIQSQILTEEEHRSGVNIDKPSDWTLARERREYNISDAVIVLSSFAHQSFVQAGFTESQLKILPLGAQLSCFRPEASIVRTRLHRIVSVQPLRILMVGSFSLRKGAVDLVEIADNLDPENFIIRFVGDICNDAENLAYQSRNSIEFVGRQPQHELPTFYDWADVFIFTTLEDGYAVVLSQAQAAGLPILATTNSAAPDLITEKEAGWILPIRSPDAFIERLNWCHENRHELSQMVEQVYVSFQPRDWSDVAQDFVNIVSENSAQTDNQLNSLPKIEYANLT